MPIAGTILKGLYVPGDTFKQLKTDKKAFLKLLLNETGDLTFGAFIGFDHDFEDECFRFIPFKNSPLKWEKNFYLGDQKIGQKKVEKILKTISTQNPDVVLVPVIDDDYPHQIAFRILVGKHGDYIKSLTDFSKKFIELGRTNPSPPRNSANN